MCSRYIYTLYALGDVNLIRRIGSSILGKLRSIGRYLLLHVRKPKSQLQYSGTKRVASQWFRRWYQIGTYVPRWHLAYKYPDQLALLVESAVQQVEGQHPSQRWVRLCCADWVPCWVLTVGCHRPRPNDCPGLFKASICALLHVSLQLSQANTLVSNLFNRSSYYITLNKS